MKKTNLKGVVVSDKMDKTIVVEVATRKRHPKYQKVLKYKRKYHVHDEKNQFKMGDEIVFFPTRPLSKLKRWSVCSKESVA